MVINRRFIPWIVAGVALVAILLIVLVIVTQAAPQQSRMYTTNLLANPGFEYGLSGWSGVLVTSTQGKIHCGNYSVQGNPTPFASAYITQSFQWNGGDLYASAWMESDTMPGFYDGYVALDGPNGEHAISDLIELTWSEWRHINISQTNAASGIWMITVGSPAAVFQTPVWIDDVWISDIDNTNLCEQLTLTPQLVSYQGQVSIGGIPFSGTGYFRFAIVDPSGTLYFWSNDGTDAITPTDAVTLTVVDGIFNTLLGETNPITYGVFSDSDRWLRVWFDDGTHGIQLLEPDTQFTTAPFAFQADHSTTADMAISATYAITADYATTALNATNATTATYATTALTATWATTATFATTADSATTALTATNATTATYATTALTATNATTATFATTALTATNATTATFATTALTATWATTATFATTALTATDGTKTVTLVPGSGSITMGANTLAYTKIGRVVYVTGYIDVASVSNPAGSLTLTGLPFTCAGGAEFYSAISIAAAGMQATATTALQGNVNGGTTTANIEKFAAGGAAWPAADVKAGTYFMLSIMYFAQT